MIQLPGLRLTFTKSKTSFLVTMNLYGVTQHILLKLNVKHYTRSQLYLSSNQFITYTSIDQKRIHQRTQPSIIMFPTFLSDLSTV
jgi:hypothetical protein